MAGERERLQEAPLDTKRAEQLIGKRIIVKWPSEPGKPDYEGQLQRAPSSRSAGASHTLLRVEYEDGDEDIGYLTKSLRLFITENERHPVKHVEKPTTFSLSQPGVKSAGSAQSGHNQQQRSAKQAGSPAPKARASEKAQAHAGAAPDSGEKATKQKAHTEEKSKATGTGVTAVEKGNREKKHHQSRSKEGSGIGITVAKDTKSNVQTNAKVSNTATDRTTSGEKEKKETAQAGASKEVGNAETIAEWNKARRDEHGYSVRGGKAEVNSGRPAAGNAHASGGGKNEKPSEPENPISAAAAEATRPAHAWHSGTAHNTSESAEVPAAVTTSAKETAAKQDEPRAQPRVHSFSSKRAAPSSERHARGQDERPAKSQKVQEHEKQQIQLTQRKDPDGERTDGTHTAEPSSRPRVHGERTDATRHGHDGTQTEQEQHQHQQHHHHHEKARGMQNSEKADAKAKEHLNHEKNLSKPKEQQRSTFFKDREQMADSNRSSQPSSSFLVPKSSSKQLQQQQQPKSAAGGNAASLGFNRPGFPAKNKPGSQQATQQTQQQQQSSEQAAGLQEALRRCPNDLTVQDVSAKAIEHIEQGTSAERVFHKLYGALNQDSGKQLHVGAVFEDLVDQLQQKKRQCKSDDESWKKLVAALKVADGWAVKMLDTIAGKGRQGRQGRSFLLQLITKWSKNITPLSKSTMIQLKEMLQAKLRTDAKALSVELRMSNEERAQQLQEEREKATNFLDRPMTHDCMRVSIFRAGRAYDDDDYVRNEILFSEDVNPPVPGPDETPFETREPPPPAERPVQHPGVFDDDEEKQLAQPAKTTTTTQMKRYFLSDQPTGNFLILLF